MSHRILLAAVLLPALSSVSAAQPGACEDCYAYGPPVVVAQPAPPIDVMSDRLGVGLHAVSLAIANREDPDAEPTHLGGGGLQVRYRLTPRWELELGFSALRETDEDGMVIDGPEIHTATLGALFHMRPGRRWDWYLIGAVGGVHVGDRSGPRANHEDGRAMGQLGIGLERRWQHLSIGVELRAVGIAPKHEDEIQTGDDRPPVATRTSGTQPPPPPPVTEDNDRRGDHGAQLSIGATYYF